MCQSSSVKDEMIKAMAYEGVSGVCDKRGGDQCWWCQIFEMRVSIPK